MRKSVSGTGITAVLAALISVLVFACPFAGAQVFQGLGSGVKGAGSGYTVADLAGDYAFTGFMIRDNADMDAVSLSGIITFSGDGGFTGGLNMFDSDAHDSGVTLGGTYTVGDDGSFLLNITDPAFGWVWNGHMSKDAEKNFLFMTQAQDMTPTGGDIFQALMHGVKMSGEDAVLEDLDGTYVLRELSFYDFEGRFPSADLVMGPLAYQATGIYTGTPWAFDRDGQWYELAVAGVTSAMGGAFAFLEAGTSGPSYGFLSSDRETMVYFKGYEHESSGGVTLGGDLTIQGYGMSVKQPVSTLSAVDLEGSYEIATFTAENFRSDSGKYDLTRALYHFDGAGTYIASFETFEADGDTVTGTAYGLYTVDAGGALSLTRTSTIPNECYTGQVSENAEVISLSRTEKHLDAKGMLLMDFGGSGLYAFDRADLRYFSWVDPEQMLTWRDGVVLDLGALGLYLFEHGEWTLLAGLDAEDMTVWGHDLVVDFGAFGVYSYNTAAWTFVTATNPEDMTGWEDDLVLDCGVLGLYRYDGTTWESLSAADPEGFAAVGDRLYIDFGIFGVYSFEGIIWKGCTDQSPEAMIEWDGIVVMDFGASGVWTYGGGEWEAITDFDPDRMLSWEPYLILDLGAAGVWAYERHQILSASGLWNVITPYDPEDMATANLGVDVFLP